ncbi:hypothetical protein BDR26DRAFT_868566, partial [Obelidium mucronatum]
MKIAAKEGHDGTCWLVLGEWILEQGASEILVDSDMGDESSTGQTNSGHIKSAVSAWTEGVAIGHIPCVKRLAQHYVSNEDYSRAIKIYQTGLELGDAECASQLTRIHGMMLSESMEERSVLPVAKKEAGGLAGGGEGIGDNNSKVLKRKIVHRRVDEDSTNELSSDSENEDVNTWTPKKIVRRYLSHCESASRCGDSSALISLASTTSVGLALPVTSSQFEPENGKKKLLLPKNDTESLSLYMKAFHSGTAPPTQSLHEAAKLLYLGSDTLPRDIPRAIDLFLLAAEAGCGSFVEIGDLITNACKGIKGREVGPTISKTTMTAIEQDYDATPGVLTLTLEKAFDCYTKAALNNEGVLCFIRLGDSLRFSFQGYLFFFTRGFIHAIHYNIPRFGRGCIKNAVQAFEAYEKGFRL